MTLTGPSFSESPAGRHTPEAPTPMAVMRSRPQTLAYYFPQWHVDPKNTTRFGPSWTEWDLLRAARPRFDGHVQPRVPLWGESDESLPSTADRAVRMAQAFGLDGFIVDWYWYEDEPFLNGYLDRGLLRGSAVDSFRFALMWANHDWTDLYPATSPKLSTLLSAPRGRDQALHAFEHVIDRYFSHPSYWRVDGRPYFSIYDLPTFVRGLGGLPDAREVLDEFRRLAAGAGGVHLNGVLTPLVGDEVAMVQALGLDSTTHYTWWHYLGEAATFPTTPYAVARRRAEAQAQRTAAALQVPFLPNVTVGWDPTPRTVPWGMAHDEGYPFTTVIDSVSPEAYSSALENALLTASENGAPAVTINAWNEWTEGSYLEPDTDSGYDLLEATRSAIHRAAGRYT